MARRSCYCCPRPARPRSYFCSNRCAAQYADELMAGNEDSWCPHCEEYVSDYDDGGEGYCGACGGKLTRVKIRNI